VPKLSQILASFEEYWPKGHADDWDRVGLVTGSHSQDIYKILVAVDLTAEVIDEAIDSGAELIVTHHPVLLKGVNYLEEDSLKGSLITKLVRANLACFSAHTNADVQTDGASSEMARAFGLANLRPLVATPNGFGHGVIGDLLEPQTLSDFATRVAFALPKTARGVALAGDPYQTIVTVAICSGAGDGFIQSAIGSEADVYVTSDLRHHPVSDALQTPRVGRRPLALIDVSHFAAESLWVGSAITRMSKIPGVQLVASKVNTDPWAEQKEQNA
jgi:dinuclear metal center YbgI/SA1388 family protein